MTDSSNARALVSLTLSFRPLANQIGPLRTLVSDLCKPHLADADGLSRLLLAAHELLENIVKYSVGEEAEFHLLVETKASGLVVRLRTKNRAAPERMADAQWRLDALANAGDPVAHYDELIRESAGRRDVSGLGLARIPAESEMQLRYATEQDWLILTAEGNASQRVAG
ncbi:MAG TPA: hypothetical protein VJV79_09830 [Polyangiaceae bacterium]|nr:hypothetical protein [Polyangiaceae bacterium]